MPASGGAYGYDQGGVGVAVVLVMCTARGRIRITKPPPMKSLSESDLQIPRAKKAQPDERVLARKALLLRIEKEVVDEIER